MTILTFAVPFIFRSPISTLPPGAVLGGGIAISAAGIAALLAVGPTLAGRSSSGMLLSGLGIGIANPPSRASVSASSRLNAAAWRRSQQHVSHRRPGDGGCGARRRVPATNHGFDVGECRRARRRARPDYLLGGHQGGRSRPTKDRRRGPRRLRFGLRTIFVIGAVLVALGAVAAACLVRSKDFHSATRSAPAPEPAPVTTERA